jgi:hypothetical protein
MAIDRREFGADPPMSSAQRPWNVRNAAIQYGDQILGMKSHTEDI